MYLTGLMFTHLIAMSSSWKERLAEKVVILGADGRKHIKESARNSQN